MPPTSGNVLVAASHPNSSIELKGVDVVRSFFDLEGVGLALKANDLDVEALVEKLKEHFDSPDARVSQKAIDQLFRLQMTVLKLNGLVASESFRQERIDGEGNKTIVEGRREFLDSRDFHSDAPGGSLLEAREFVPPNPDAAAEAAGQSRKGAAEDQQPGSGSGGGSDLDRAGGDGSGSGVRIDGGPGPGDSRGAADEVRKDEDQDPTAADEGSGPTVG